MRGGSLRWHWRSWAHRLGVLRSPSCTLLGVPFGRMTPPVHNMTHRVPGWRLRQVPAGGSRRPGWPVSAGLARVSSAGVSRVGGCYVRVGPWMVEFCVSRQLPGIRMPGDR